ncbi:iris-like isoform X2 [Dermacentor variabilis]|uniref:iris-like isoform X2 n=1 Tax=Dermacentor variabilis TaxID=34621 RepID=UPI003F5C64C6
MSETTDGSPPSAAAAKRAARAEAQRRRRQNPEVRAAEAEAYRRRRRDDPGVRVAEAEAKRRRREDPAVRAAEAEAHRRRREQPAVSEAEAEAHRRRREDPAVRAAEAEAHRRRREQPAVSEAEAEAHRRRREDPAVRTAEAEAHRRRREQPAVSEAEAEAHRRRREDSTVRAAEAEAKRKQRLANSQGATNAFRRQFTDNPFGSLCSVCDRLWFQNDVKPLPDTCRENLRCAFPNSDLCQFRLCSSCMQSVREGYLTMATSTTAMPVDLTTPISAFTIDLYKQLDSGSDGTKNVVFSPFSIAAALSMTLAGAKDHTATEITNVLHINGDVIHAQFSEFFAKVETCAPDVMLDVANRLYSEKTFVVLEDYISTLKKFYNSTVMPVDFKSSAEAARLAINAWVEETTKSKIKDLLPSGAVDSDTALVLINAIYFKGLWKDQFNPKATTLQEFHRSKETAKEVQMMHKQSRFKINTKCTDLNANAIEIPYKGGKTSMVILLPHEVDGLPDLEATLTPSKLLDVLNGLDSKTVALSLPRFRIEYRLDLKKTLHVMGIKDLFTDKADLSGIDGKKDLMVSAAVHKAFVEVNEEGTEAAAATGMLGRPKSAVRVIPFSVDHPFMFFIRSHDPDVILFAGSVRNV